MKTESSTKVMKRIADYAGGHRHLITAGRIIAALSAFAAMVPFNDLWRIIRIAVKGEELGEIKWIALQAVGITIGALLLYIAALFCTHIAAFRVQANMRSRLMRRILTLPLGVFDEDGTGKIRRIVNESTAATETYIAHNLPDKAVAAATPVGLIILLAIFDWRIGLICVIPAIIGFLFMMSMMGKDMQEKMAEYQNALDTMSSEATEYVRGVPVVKVFGQSVHSFKRFKSAIDGFGKWATQYTLMLRMPMTAFMTCINAVFAFIVLAAFIFTRGGVTSDMILNVMYYIIVTPLLTVTLTKIAYSGEQEMVVIDALKRMDSILDIEPLKAPEKTEHPKDNSVELRNVAYRYKDSAEDAVHDLNIRIASGEHIALVGPSGGGKTTTAELIARFFDVTGGSILIGGADIRNIPQDELMDQVSFVFQDSKLLKASVLENVRLARPEASEQEVMKALETAQCSDIIEKLPEGIHTVIGTKGTFLSGGEHQRIAIARAVLKNSPITILDEATAFADPDNETKVQAAFGELAKGKTVIMIAHRLSTVVNTDCIYVLKNGTVCESGTHEELMKLNGQYKTMFEEYNRSVNWKVGAHNENN
ncbi:MAG: ABC transporter ATP-binding protein [Ruminococcus sp.]|nr:ABC transporter ATP-binding protein [Ruminococcus sp.]